MSLLSATEVVVELGGRRVLAGVDFRIEAGQLVGLIGANGAGKTTLMRTLAGLQDTRSGHIAFEGRPLREFPPRALAQRLAYLPQHGGSYWDITVEVLVRLGRLAHLAAWSGPSPADLAAVERALAAIGVAALRDRPFSQLSGGEKARVLLARALAGEPRLLLADEPVSDLDPYHRLEVMEHLQRLAASGMAVVVILHDLTLAARFAQRLVLLDRGRVAASGTPEEVITPAQLARCFRIRAHSGRLAEGAFVVPVERITDAGSRGDQSGEGPRHADG
ncbi:MAG: ABC transporter ATP-binding protein [Kiloniellales bacterium]